MQRIQTEGTTIDNDSTGLTEPPAFLYLRYPTMERPLSRENLRQLWVLNGGDLAFCFHSTLPRKTFIKGFTKGEPLTALGSQQRGPCFLLPQNPSAEDFYKGFYKRRTFDSSGFSTEGTLLFASTVP